MKRLHAQSIPTATLALSNRKNLLLIDDDEIFGFVTKEILQNVAAIDKVEIFHSGFDALQRLFYNGDAVAAPDIILLDINMPGMNGWEFIDIYQENLHQLKKKTQLYIISSSVSDEDKARASEAVGVSGYFEKPITQVLIEKLIGNIPE